MQLTVYRLPFPLYFKLFELLCYHYKRYLSVENIQMNQGMNQ